MHAMGLHHDPNDEQISTAPTPRLHCNLGLCPECTYCCATKRRRANRGITKGGSYQRGNGGWKYSRSLPGVHPVTPFTHTASPP